MTVFARTSSVAGQLSGKPQIVYLVGPTGVGKTATALSVAASVRAEIVSADSMQVYRYLDIGTAKPTPEQRRCIPHHLIDVVDPDQSFDAALFRQLATEAIGGILARGHKVVVCGGTGLYLKALERGLLDAPGRDEAVRNRLREKVRRNGLGCLFEELQRVDPSSAVHIDPRNGRRIERALEVFLLTGRPLSEWHREHQFEEKSFDVLKIGLRRPRSELYRRIDERCEQMLRAGFLQEVAALLDRGYAAELPSLRGVGYRQMVEQLRGDLTPEDALRLMQRDTRRLAKRQLTWFRADPEIVWVSADDTGSVEKYVRAFLG